MKKGILYASCSYFIWGALPLYWQLLADLDPLCILCYRIIWSGLISLAAVTAAGRWGEVKAALRDRKTCLVLLAAGAVVSLNWGLFIFAVNNGHVLDSSLANFLGPIVMIFFGFLLFRERLSACRWGAVVLAFAGILFSVLWYRTVPVLAVGIALTAALYSAIKKKVTVSGDVSIFIENLLVLPVAAVLLTTMELRGAGAVGVVTGWRWLLLPVAGLATYIPLLLLSKGVQLAPMSVVGITMYINPVLQLVLGIWVFHEEMTAPNLVSFLCVAAAVLLFTAGDRLVREHIKEKTGNEDLHDDHKNCHDNDMRPAQCGQVHTH